jgi:hypothetical protein
MRQQLSETREQAILFAWEGQLKATNNSSLKQQCLRREAELLPQFVQHFKKFKALPHPPAKDRRGTRRPQDGNQDGGTACDIGLYKPITTPPITETYGRVSATILGTAGSTARTRRKIRIH